MNKIELGDKVKDEVSGIEGIVVGITQFIHGCLRVTIAPQAKKGEKEPPETFTADLPQCKLVKKSVVSTTAPAADVPKERKKTTGGPAPFKVSKY